MGIVLAHTGMSALPQGKSSLCLTSVGVYDKIKV